jgi:hypothetical protein
MTEHDQPEQLNNTYLSAALHWLRLLLIRMAASAGPPPPIDPGPPPPAKCGMFRRKKQPHVTVDGPRHPVPTDKDIAQAAAAMNAAAESDPPPPLILLSRRLELSAFERNVLLLCAALELDTRIGELCARAQHAPHRPYPTFALALAMFDDPAWEVMSPGRPLRFWRLIDINQPGAEPLTTSALRADERIVNYIKGLNYLDDRLTPLLMPFDAPAGSAVAPSQQHAADHVAHLLGDAAGGVPPPIQLVGPDPLSKQLVAQQAADTLGLNVFRMPGELLPQQAGDLETLARLWHRESLLLPIALFLDTHDQGGEQKADGAAHTMGSLERFLARSHGVFLISSREPRATLPRTAHTVDVDKPTRAEQLAAWSHALGDAAGDSPALLAGQFNLNTVTIAEIAETALADDADGTPLHDRLWAACRARTRPQLERLAHRIYPVATWDDIVLPDEELRVLRQLAAQVAHRTTVYDTWGFRQRMTRGLGINALFAGESGTGKTLAAEVIANHLQLDLYRIDLSAVVSKYIGETEKNLRRLFDAAEDGGAILFFDEADALFGKRSEVRDSHDRYANIEINYLLQRMESYGGLAVLATNMKSALDKAFLRRLRFVLTFPFPGKAQREAIWRHAWPADTPVRGLDYEHLARFNLTGGSIANTALNAAFLAADRGEPVTMPIVLDAVRVELGKLERPSNEADFAWHEPRGSRDDEAVA